MPKKPTRSLAYTNLQRNTERLESEINRLLKKTQRPGSSEFISLSHEGTCYGLSLTFLKRAQYGDVDKFEKSLRFLASLDNKTIKRIAAHIVWALHPKDIPKTEFDIKPFIQIKVGDELFPYKDLIIDLTEAMKIQTQQVVGKKATWLNTKTIVCSKNEFAASLKKCGLMTQGYYVCKVPQHAFAIWKKENQFLLYEWRMLFTQTLGGTNGMTRSVSHFARWNGIKYQIK